MELMEKIDLLLNEADQQNFIFDADNMEKHRKTIQRGLNVPHANVSISRLGGTPTIMIKASLDPREQWNNDILENSRYFIASIDADASKSNLEVYHTSHKIEGKKMKKQKAKSVEDAIRKLNTWINKVK